MDKTAFEGQMQADEALALEVAKHREMHTYLRDKDVLDFRAKIQKIHKEVMVSEGFANDNEAQEDTKHTSKSAFPYWKLAIAAVFVIGLGVLFWDNGGTNSQGDLYAMYYTPFPVDDTTRGEETQDAMTQVFEFYEAEHYEKTIPVLEKRIWQTNKQKLRLYLGNSYLNTNQAKKAAGQFRKIPESSMFFEDAQWYLALTYLKRQVSDSTQYFLQNVVNYKGIHEKKAKKLLEQLK